MSKKTNKNNCENEELLNEENALAITITNINIRSAVVKINATAMIIALVVMNVNVKIVIAKITLMMKRLVI